MSDIQTGLPIQPEVALHKLLHSGDLAADDGDVTRESQELAAAQLAICLAVKDQVTPHVPKLEHRISEHNDATNPDGKPGRFTVDEVLDDTERSYLPAARVIVGLTYQAARYNSQTRVGLR